MVDLPIPDQPDVLAQTPTPRVSGFQYARAGSFLAQGLDKLSDGLNDIAVPMAKAQAAQDLQNGSAVTRDAQGNVQVGKPPGMPILGPAGEAYAHAIAAGQLAAGDNQTTQDVAQLRASNEGNPQGFLQAGGSYVQNLTARNPGPTGQAMAERAQSLISQHYAGMVQQQAQVGVSNAKQAIVDARTNAFNELATLAQNGVTSGPEWDKAQSSWQATSRQLTANPAFGISQQLQDAHDNDERSLLHQFSVVGGVDADVKKNGVVVARQNLYDAIHDPGAQLSPEQQNSLLRAGEGRIQFIVGQNAADAAVNRENVTALREHAMDPRVSASLSEPIWQAALAKSRSIPGAEVETAVLATAHQAWQAQRGVPGLSPQQSAQQQGVGPQAAVDAAPNGGGRVGGTTGAAYLAALSSGDVQGALRASEGLRTGAYWDVNHWRTGYGSDTITNPDGSTQAVGGANGGNPNIKPDTQIAPADAERDLQRRTADYAQGIQKQIGPAWGKLAPSAQAALTSVAYNYGHLPGDIAQAATSGDPAAIAAAIRGHASDNAGANFSRRQAEASAVLGAPAGSAPSAAPGGHFTQAQLAANPFLISSWVQSIARDPERQYAYARDLGSGIEMSVRNGVAPSVETMAAYTQIAASEPRLAEQAQRIRASVEGAALGDTAMGGALSDTERSAFAASGFHNLPPAHGQAYVDAVKQASQGGSIYQMQVAQAMSEYYDRGMKQLREDPFGTAAIKGWGKAPDPLNVDDPRALAVGLHQRSDLFDSIAAHGAGSLASSALDKNGVEQLRGAIAGGTGAQLQNITAAIVTTPAARRAATIAELGPAIMGAANSSDPGKMKVAYGFLGKQFDENPVTFRRDFGKDAANQLLAYQNATQYMPPEIAAKRVQGWTDPAQETTRQGVAEAAKKELSSVSADQVAQKWATFSYINPWYWGGVKAATPTTDSAATSGEGLRNEYAQNYTYQRQLGMDAAHADANAVAMLKTKWGVSGVNGNMVMQHPPEANYPAIGGSHDWIGEQLDGLVKDATGAGRYGLAAHSGAHTLIGMAEGPSDQTERAKIDLYQAPRAIAADDTTEADLAAGKPPSYYIVTKDGNGLWNPLTSDGHTLVRFRPDPAAAPAHVEAVQHAQQNADQDAAYAATKAGRHRTAWTDAQGNYRPPGAQ